MVVGGLRGPSCTSISHRGRIAQTKFVGDRNLDLNQEFPRMLDMAPWLLGSAGNVRFGSEADMML